VGLPLLLLVRGAAAGDVGAADRPLVLTTASGTGWDEKHRQARCLLLNWPAA
jgi:hypothetical protein